MLSLTTPAMSTKAQLLKAHLALQISDSSLGWGSRPGAHVCVHLSSIASILSGPAACCTGACLSAGGPCQAGEGAGGCAGCSSQGAGAAGGAATGA